MYRLYPHNHYCYAYINTIGYISTTPTLPVCPGTCVTVNAIATNLGSSAVYLWQLNGNPFSGNDSTSQFTYCNFANGDTLSVSASSTEACASSIAATNGIDIVMHPLPIAPAISTSGNVTLTSDQQQGNQWYMAGNPNSIGNTQSINVNQNGDYYLVYTDANGCTIISDTVNVVITNINTYALQALVVYPNPSTGNLTIETTMLSTGNIGLELRNMLGQIVYSTNDKAQSGLYRKNLALDLTNGLYFLTLQTNEGRIVRKIEIAK